jgi:hypothetical protein
MITEKQLSTLLKKWSEDSDGYRAEAQRLERIDRNRHGTSVAMLEASAQAIEKCVMDIQGLLNFQTPLG